MVNLSSSKYSFNILHINAVFKKIFNFYNFRIVLFSVILIKQINNPVLTF